MTKEYLGKSIPKLGFGLMRMPENDGVLDKEQIKKMVDLYLASGFNYFDTAFMYHGGASESMVKEAITSRHPRENYYLATKFPLSQLNVPEDKERIINTQLERTGSGYFDFYLLHGIKAEVLAKADKFGVWDFLKGLKEKGIVKHIGFSYHDSAAVLDEILSKHPEFEFVQLQINYVDWEDETVQSRKCYEVARKYNKPVIIMEPVKGGALATARDDIVDNFKQADPDASVASWAVRFAASLDGVITVLSGMSSLEQMQDNISYMKNFKPLEKDDYKVIDRSVVLLKSISSIPCTSCKYCIDVCPQGIPIPTLIDVYNKYKTYVTYETYKRLYGLATKPDKVASSCISCRQCENICPQHIGITGVLEKLVTEFE